MGQVVEEPAERSGGQQQVLHRGRSTAGQGAGLGAQLDAAWTEPSDTALVNAWPSSSVLARADEAELGLSEIARRAFPRRACGGWREITPVLSAPS
jgi:hypothetical protein